MKNIILLFVFLSSSLLVRAQEYYETSWISGEVKYTALVIFYEEDQAIVRVKYYANGADKLAGFLCKYENFTKADGTQDEYLNGSEAFIVRGPEGSSYSADNFYVKILGNNNFEAYTVDDNGLGGNDITLYMKPMLYWVKLNPDALTKGYLDDYYNEDELLFKLLTYINKGEVEYTTSNTAVTSIAMGMDQEYDTPLWSVAMSYLGTKAYSEQKIKESTIYPNDWIKAQWDLGYFITAVEYNTYKSTFIVVMSKAYGMGPQSWQKSDVFPKDWVTTKWNDYYYITEIACGGGNWYVVMDKNIGYTAQRWKTSYDIPKDWITENWNEGYSITSVAYGNGLWALSMSAGSNLGLQTWKTQYEYPIDWIREQSDKGYKITTVAYGNDMWFVVMSDGSSHESNRSKSNYTDIPLDWIIDNAN
ncbi:hypothetical protein [Allomuricauda sp. M10]|uniref:DUF7477 domain-containing protein n=1 Tax=Allomuricauda sp. M10 TaxID=2683292 RepID=UPI001D1885B3|nr:hypothetical protein [Muricauda sp. M10]